MTQEEYTDLVNSVEQCIKDLRPLRKDQAALDNASKLLVEFRWNGQHNQIFRQESVKFLEEMLDEMYEEINTDGN